MYSTDAIVYYMYLIVYVSDIFPSEIIITKSMNKHSLRPQRDESVDQMVCGVNVGLGLSHISHQFLRTSDNLKFLFHENQNT